MDHSLPLSLVRIMFGKILTGHVHGSVFNSHSGTMSFQRNRSDDKPRSKTNSPLVWRKVQPDVRSADAGAPSVGQTGGGQTCGPADVDRRLARCQYAAGTLTQ